MNLPTFWPLTEDTASELAQALVWFAPKPYATPAELNAAWANGPLPRLLGPRKWAHVLTVDDDCTTPLALSQLHDAFSSTHITPGPDNRGAVLIPNGQEFLGEELNLAAYPYFDLIGESKEGTILTYGALDNKATLYTKGTQSLIAHMTVERLGGVPDPRGPGMGVRYAIHDNTPSTEPRTVLFVDLDCKSPSDSPGIGTGICSGGLHLYVAVNADNGFFAHNADDIREAWEAGVMRPTPPDGAALVYLNCTSGYDAANRPGCGIRYWNMGSGQWDILALWRGTHIGAQYGLRVVNFGQPFKGESETKVLLNCDLRGAVYSFVLPDGTERI